MLIHQVFFSFKPELTKDYIEEVVLKNLLAMEPAIPELKTARWYKNESQEGLDKGFNYQAIFTFADADDLNSYLVHPAHVAFCNDFLFPSLPDRVASLLVFDYTE